MRTFDSSVEQPSSTVVVVVDSKLAFDSMKRLDSSAFEQPVGSTIGEEEFA